MRRFFFILLLLVARTGLAGWYYESTTISQGEDSTRIKAMNHSTRTWLSGDKVKVEFLTSQLPAIPPGANMVSMDGGSTIHLLNPAHKNYYLMDLAAMRGLVGGMMKILNPVIEKVADERNGAILGLPVRYVKFRTTYDVQIAVLGIKDITRIETEQEMWVAENITDAGSTFWTGQSGYATGDDEYDAMMHREAGQIKGLPLRQTIVIRSTNANGQTKETTSRMEVTSIRELDVGDELFEIPDDYEETSFLKMQNPGGIEKAEEQPEEIKPEADTEAVLEMMEKFNQPDDVNPENQPVGQ